MTRRREALGRARPELGVLLVAELRPVAMRLFKVVPDDLVQLDELGAVLGQPVRKQFVQLGAGRLRERLVRRVADQ